MARAKLPEITTVSGLIGKPNLSVAEIKEYYKIEKERQQKNYTNAKEAASRFLRDLQKTTKNRKIDSTDREKVKKYITDIGNNGKSLIKASRYLYYRSQIYNKLIHFYADMYCLECRKVPIGCSPALNTCGGGGWNQR